MSSDWPLTKPVNDHPAAVTLLGDLQGNLWASLRHTLDLDKVTLAALSGYGRRDRARPSCHSRIS